MATIAIFYSWQSDLPNQTNRSFIETALERAVRTINRADKLEVECAIDRDTAGMPGAPHIAESILAKIRRAAIFVADVSIITTREARYGGNIFPLRC